MPYFIKHRPSDLYLGPFRGKPGPDWPADVDQAKPFDSRLSAQAVIAQMAHAFAGDRPDPMDPKYCVSDLRLPEDKELIKLRRAARNAAEKEWKEKRDAWVDLLVVVETGQSSDVKTIMNVTPEQAQEIRAKIKSDKTPNVMTQLGQRKLDLEIE